MKRENLAKPSLENLEARPEFRGLIETYANTSFRGWCLRATELTVSVELELSINGVELGTTIANLPRADIAQALDQAYGYGFVFDLAPVAKIERESMLRKLLDIHSMIIDNELDIEFSVKGQKVFLPHSPRLCFSNIELDSAIKILTKAIPPEVHALEAPPPRSDHVEIMVKTVEPIAAAETFDLNQYATVESEFDVEFYLAGFGPEQRPSNPIGHYLTIGWKEGRDPAPWFSGHHYLATHSDVVDAKMNPFHHYCLAGKREGRPIVRLGLDPQGDVYEAHSYAVSPGPFFEEFDPKIGKGRKKRAKIIAYYLPQFHPVEVNDQSWGRGFTEWRNLPRAMPRFMGHIQPRIPRDLGCYNLAEDDVMRRQIEMAKAAGLFGFCFYHYWFDGQRVLEAPMERLLADPSLDFPFCLMWANENWTRTWDGAETDIILKQSYRAEDDDAFIDDLARHMKDRRYIRIGQRPLLFIYRPSEIPDAKNTLSRWRANFLSRHGLSPVIMMAQGFGDLDPGQYELDGAIEFPPHKICQNLPPITSGLHMLDVNYTGYIVSYDQMVERSISEISAPYPLIRTVTPTWDNDARRPGRGMIIHGSSPEKFEAWVSSSVQYSLHNAIEGESFVCINAWNEWAEGACLEPDVHYGGAFLNAVSRVVHGVGQNKQGQRPKVLLVGHDTYPNGAQMLLGRIGEELLQGFGIEVEFLILSSDGFDEGASVNREKYSRVGKVSFVDRLIAGPERFLSDLNAEGFSLSITNTTVTGSIVPLLKQAEFNVVSLVHELTRTLNHYSLANQAEAIAQHSDYVIFPAKIVEDSFVSFAGDIAKIAEIFPQGLHMVSVLEAAAGDNGLRAEFDLPKLCRIVLCAAYGDLRKGIDRFLMAGIAVCGLRSDVVFIWVGPPAGEPAVWFMSEVEAAGLSHRIRIVGQRDDLPRFYAAADVFYLSSREDPFPSVLLEALASGLPVVGHRGTGGCDELVARHGILIPETNPAGSVDAILALLDGEDRHTSDASAARRAEIEQNYRFDDYVFGLVSRLVPDLASVSAVVPNYNYEHYIRERLQTIFDQTYPLREVVVLDDASPDNSIDVIYQTADTAGRTISLHVNDKNSGSPFPQWRKGVQLARGEYVWIAEADDLAEPAFVSTLVARMQRSGAAIGFADMRQMDENDTPLGPSYRPYLNQIEPGAFDRAFDMSGSEFLSRFLAVKNVILNVSGALFRRDALLAALDRVGPELDKYGVAGDWRLYAEICAAGGSVTYDPTVLNAHRRHKISVTHALKVDRHLAEIAGMHALVAERVVLDDAVKVTQSKHFDACRIQLEN